MSNQYRFPCSCGKENLIEPSQAGQTIACDSCGADLELPSLMKIKQLEPVAIQQSKSKSEETGRSYTQSVVLTLGLAAFLLGAIAAGTLFYLTNQFYAERPELPPESRKGFAARLDANTLAQNVDLWEDIKKGGPGEWEPHAYITGEILSSQFRLFAYIASGVAGLGILMVVASFFIKSKPRKRLVKKRA